MQEPPSEFGAEDLQLGLEHAEDELRLTELSASFPRGVTLVLLRHTKSLGLLFRWITAQPTDAQEAPPDTARAQCLAQEAREFCGRVALLRDAVAHLRGRLPDPELPIRWAHWFEDVGEAVGLPRAHCQRFRSQREQVALVWANNRRTLLSADEHVEALALSLGDVDELVAGGTPLRDREPRAAPGGGDRAPAPGEGAAGRPAAAAGACCAAGVAKGLRALLRWRPLPAR